MSAMGDRRGKLTPGNRLLGLLMTSAASVSVLTMLPAMAQTSTGDQAAAAGAPALEEITVTARRRSEDIQKTPISITAFSAAQLQQQNVHDISDLRGLAPNFEITSYSNFGRAANPITIRGIGQNALVPNLDPGVGFYLDDLYISRVEGQLLSFYDVANVQILKGPQGTLFGKNTIGGALLLDTQQPKDTFGGYVDVRVGEYNRIDAEGAINVPVTDKFAVRVSFMSSNVDGYIDHKLDSVKSDDLDEKSGRIQFLVKPTDDLSINLLGEYDRHKDHGNASIVTGCHDGAYATGNYNATHPGQPTYCQTFPIIGKQYQVTGTPFAAVPTNTLPGGFQAGKVDPYFGHEAPFTKVEVGTINLRINYALDENLSLKSVTGFRRSSLRAMSGEAGDGGTPLCIYCEEDATTTEQTSEELNLSGNYWDGALTFVVGAVYVNQSSGFAQNTGPDFDGDATGYSFLDSENFESDAVYAQATYKITDQLSATAGARYSYDRKSVESVLWNALGDPTYLPGGGYITPVPYVYFTDGFFNGKGGYYLPGPGPGARQRAAASYYDFDPRFQLDYQWTPEFMTYVSVTGGYQSGGFNTQLVPVGLQFQNGMSPFGKERVWDYEAGIKSEWLEHRLRINATGFYQDYQNIQATVIAPGIVPLTRRIVNSAAAHESGFELEVEALPTPDLVIRANAAYLNQGYDTLSPQAIQTGITLQSPLTTAPTWEASVAVDYTYHLPWDAALVADLNYRWLDSRIAGTAPVFANMPAYYTVGAKLTYVAPDGSYSVGVWGNNLTGKYYYTGASSDSNGNFGLVTVTPGRPREVGIELKYNFDAGSTSDETPAAYVPPPVIAPAPSVPKSYLVFFDFNKSDLTSQAEAIVDQAAKNAGPAKVTQLTVTGHTDTVGSDAYNMRLSRRRAESVAAQLEKDGISSSEIELVAKGKRDLLVPTGDGVREPQNRRVQIVYAAEASS
ncbi:MAG: TonB-dependent receptor [Rhodospirillales bacterium]|nr:TonB-dependent receptor [Rhodospirillales bacterium]